MDDKYEKAIADINSDRRTNSFSTHHPTKNCFFSHQQLLQELERFLYGWENIVAESGSTALFQTMGFNFSTLTGVEKSPGVSRLKLNQSITSQKVWEV